MEGKWKVGRYYGFKRQLGKRLFSFVATLKTPPFVCKKQYAHVITLAKNKAQTSHDNSKTPVITLTTNGEANNIQDVPLGHVLGI